MSEPATESPTRITLVDGNTATPLSAEALVVALFACGLLIVKQPSGQVSIEFNAAKAWTLAIGFQERLDRGETLKLEKQHIFQPTNGGGLVAP